MGAEHKNEEVRRTDRTDGRFVAGGAAAAAFHAVPRSVLAGGGKKSPGEKLNIAGVGLGAEGCWNLEHCETENIVALCDVDWKVASSTFDRYSGAARYKDYRRMLDKEKDIDAVIVATPDHTHAVIAAEAMKRGKHVYCQMPLTHDVWEARQLTKIAEKTGVTTQMGNARHSGPDIRRACEWVWSGALGDVREVHCWTDLPRWPQGVKRPKGKPSVPSRLDWNLWLGPAPKHAYNPAYHPYRWRGWTEFGTGALGAMGCDLLDAPFWALKLDQAASFTVDATSTGASADSYPEASVVRYRFPARGDMPPVTVNWYDGGLQPPRPAEMPETREHVGGSGVIFVGDECKMAFGPLVDGTLRGQAGPRLMPEHLTRSKKRPKKQIPRVKERFHWREDSRHEQEWIRACKKGEQPCANFGYSGPLTEMVLLGNVALLSGGYLEWDSDSMKAKTPGKANDLIRREYRSPWSL